MMCRRCNLAVSGGVCCSVPMDTWCAQAVCHTCWLMAISRTRLQHARVVAVRLVVRYVVAIWLSRRPSRSCRHCVSSALAHCHGRCCHDMRWKCAKIGELADALLMQLGIFLGCFVRSDMLVVCVWCCSCQVIWSLDVKLHPLLMSLQSCFAVVIVIVVVSAGVQDVSPLTPDVSALYHKRRLQMLSLADVLWWSALGRWWLLDFSPSLLLCVLLYVSVCVWWCRRRKPDVDKAELAGVEKFQYCVDCVCHSHAVQLTHNDVNL